ncbi:hypothetical protein GCM10023094_19720 [Rhodococcus olei]|uniref:Uncharacterized protein n=1 Tax=Rhodococcus olei TaxID=2161675 RepID=A0ABP8P1N0_9NOCA
MPDTSAPESPNRRADPVPSRPLPAAATALAVTVLAGVWPLTGTVMTYVPALLVPSAIGLPFAVPALRPWPLGRTTTGHWLVDLLAALVLIAVVAVRLTRPVAGPWRAFAAGVGATVVGMVAANLIRSVYLSFVEHAGLGTYLFALLGGAALAVIWGTAAGILVGAVHAAATARPARRSAEHPVVTVTAESVTAPQGS